jgi:hypothetical protein
LGFEFFRGPFLQSSFPPPCFGYKKGREKLKRRFFASISVSREHYCHGRRYENGHRRISFITVAENSVALTQNAKPKTQN